MGPAEVEYSKYAEGDRVKAMESAEVGHKKYAVGNSVKTNNNEVDESSAEVKGTKSSAEGDFVKTNNQNKVGYLMAVLKKNKVENLNAVHNHSGEKSHPVSKDSVVDDQDKKGCSWSLDTEENPNNCGKNHIVGVQNDMDEKSHPNSLKLDENPDQCEKSHLEGEQNDESEKCRIESLEKENGVENGEKGRLVFIDYNTDHINNNEGGHALKSKHPEVKGGALHGATDVGGEASQKIYASADGGPRSRVRARGTLRSAPHQH